ncbi:hypothetical protein IT568_06755, partial [bacterium]|nr:hypothetical protein [bacterium]
MKLITALGIDFKLTVQLVDFFNGNFDYKPEFNFIKNEFANQKIDELYLILTSSEKIKTSFETLKKQLFTDYPNLKIFSIQLSFEDLRTNENDKELKQTLYKQVEKIAGKNLLVSSGGLKNITQRLLEAAYLFGAKGYFSMTSDETLNLFDSNLKDIRNRTKELNVQFTKTSDLLKERRTKAFEKTHSLTDNFSSVYLLPQTVLEKLLTEKITEKDLHWLKQLPKTDLHCHLGGFGNAKFLKKAAKLILEDFKTDLSKLKSQVENFFGCKTFEIDFQKFRQKFPAQNHCLENLQKFYSSLNFHDLDFVTNAAFLKLLTENQVQNLMFEDFQNSFKNKGLEVYTQIGNFGGSALLQTEKLLRFALSELFKASLEQNVRYLEVRCSPENYTKGGLSGTQVLEILLDEAEKFTGLHKNFSVNFLVMGTRHKDVKLIE